MSFLLFIFGAAVGSFINVLAVRYDPERSPFARAVFGGRSHCPNCKKTLRWFELVPVVSFIAQGGRCRRCGARLSFQYPAVEVLSGLIFVFVPARLGVFGFFGPAPTAVGAGFALAEAALWILVFLTFLLIALIDLRLSIIPDEANIFLGILGLVLTGISVVAAPPAPSGFMANPWVNHAVAALLGGLFFGFLILITRGKGMGIGDAKFAIPLGLLFGLPGIAALIGLAFVIGAVFGVGAILSGRKGMKSAIPFGPFLVAASAVVFFWGESALRAYVTFMP